MDSWWFSKLFLKNIVTIILMKVYFNKIEFCSSLLCYSTRDNVSITISHKFTFTNDDLKHKIEHGISFFIIKENYNNIKTGCNRITNKEMNLYKRNVGFVFGVRP